MLELTSAGRPVRLPRGASVQLEYHSPLFDEDYIKGEFSYSFAVSAAENGRLYGFPERLDRQGELGETLPAELLESGLPLLVGTQRVTAASAKQYTVSLQNGLSGASLSGRQLSSFAYGGLREVPRFVPGGVDSAGQPLQLPGLGAHANEVAANPDAYDYVFAPLRNEYRDPASVVPAPADPQTYPEQTVNRWTILPVSLYGLPAGGTFPLPVFSYSVPGSIPSSASVQEPLFCPFPRLRYVLRAIFEESGLVVDVENLLPGELGELVLVGNAVLVNRSTRYAVLSFSLADVLPAMTVAELLAALRADLGIVVYQDARTRRVRSAYLYERVARQAPAPDLTSLRAGLPSVQADKPAEGITLTTGIDSEDALTKELPDKQPKPLLILSPVATVADLPPTANLQADNPKEGQVRLVEETGMYYACTLSYRDMVSVNLTWTAVAWALPRVDVDGGGSEEASTLCFTPELPTYLDSLGSLHAPVPAVSQVPYRADQQEVPRSKALRLLFYNGLQLASDGVSLYPQLSHRSASGQLSTRLDGDAGTYEQLLSGWLRVKRQSVSYTQPLRLTPLDLARLDMSQPLLLDGVRVLPRKLQVTVPLRKPATLEVVRV